MLSPHSRALLLSRPGVTRKDIEEYETLISERAMHAGIPPRNDAARQRAEQRDRRLRELAAKINPRDEKDYPLNVRVAEFLFGDSLGEAYSEGFTATGWRLWYSRSYLLFGFIIIGILYLPRIVFKKITGYKSQADIDFETAIKEAEKIRDRQ